MRTEILLIIIGMAAATFFTRFGAFLMFKQTGAPKWLTRWTKHVPTGMLTALIVPSLFLPQGALDISVHNHYLLAGIIAALAAYFYRNVVATLGIGFAVMLSLRWLAI